jgi:hypothetical protein
VPRTVRVPRWALYSVVGAGLAVLVLATTAQPVRLLRLPSDDVATGRPPGPLATASASATAASGSPTTDAVQPYDLPWVRPVVLGILVAVGVLMLAGTVVALIHVARRLWEDRWQAPDVPDVLADERLDVDLTASRQAATDVVEQMQQALRAGTPRNAVVQCWLLLVGSLERRGVAADPAQSATEYARYALSRVSTDGAAVAELTGLFLEARFSDHEIGEDARARAERALQRVVASLPDDRAAATSAAGAVP